MFQRDTCAESGLLFYSVWILRRRKNACFNFFLGSIFILLDFNVQLGQTISIGLLPATVGYVLLAVGLKKMRFYCPRYKNWICMSSS